ncbi:MAG TPA: glycosyltransferase family protein [Polyangiaceae bacterium]|nr:glycosyltransferase family protein [Polyangiaceae bacterium]
MARLFISMAGEGRGHASRVLALLPELAARHDVALFAPGDAYALLEPVARRMNVCIERIPGLANRYAADGSVNYPRTFASGARFATHLPRLIGQLAERIRADRPDLVITDFEPALPRAAERCEVPYISVNHQHFMIVSDLSSLPGTLRWHATWMGAGIRFMYWHQVATIVSSFFHLPLKPRYRDVEQVGVLLRPEVLERSPRDGEHVLVYSRRSPPEALLGALRATRRPMLVYGANEALCRGNLECRRVDGETFADDLAGARALICTAGNQIVGEALYLGKPVLALPEPNNFEQDINGYFVEQLGAGRSVPLARCDLATVRSFLAAVDAAPSTAFRRRAENGIPKVLDRIEHELG